jgi:hypothetical protein
MRQLRGLFALAGLLASVNSLTGAELFLSGLQAEQLVVERWGIIYWKANCGSGGVAPGTQTRISSQSLDRPVSPFTILSRTTCTGSDTIPGRIAVAGSAFYVNGQGSIHSQSGYSGVGYGSSPDPDRITPAGLVAVSQSQIFWTDEQGEFYEAARLWARPRNFGGAPELVASYVTSPQLYFKKLHVPPGGVLFALLSDDRLVYYAFRPGFPPNPGQWIQTTVASRVTAVAFSSDRICWVEKNAAGTLATFISAPHTDTALRTTLGSEALGVNDSIVEMALGNNQLFYQIGNRLGGARIKRRSALAAGSAVELEALSYQALDMGATDRWVCWRRHNYTPVNPGSQSDDIFRLPVGAAAVTRNLAAVGIPEVIQAIQNAANIAPLVANKVTHVRAFGRIVSSSAAETSLHTGPNMALHGTRGGVPLPGSPLLPTSVSVPAPPLQTSAGDRANQGDGYWFRLPASWTTEGTVTLSAEVNPNRTYSETTFADNRATTTVTFTPKVPIGLKIIPTLTHYGTITRYSPALEQMFDQLESLIPTSDLRVEVTRDFLDEDHVFSHSPFEFRADDDDKDKVLLGLRWKKVFGSGGQLAEPGGFDHYISVLPQAAQQHRYSGYASVGWDLPTGTQVQPNHFFFLNPGRSALGIRADVETAAQELAHNYARYHVGCGNPLPDNIDSSYPYPTDTISSPAAGFLGFNYFANRLIGATEARDYMSYCGPAWTSDYTWTALFNRISTGYGPALAAAGAGSPAPAGLTGGVIDLHDAVADMHHVFQLGAAETACATASPCPVNPQYELRAYKNGGDLSSILPVHTSIPANDEDHGPATTLVWMTVIDKDLSQVVKLELIDKQNPAVPLGRLEGGNAAPVVNIIAPVAGPVPGPELKIRWDSTDDGGGPLSHIVRYSHDNGASWRTLIMHTDTNQLTVDTATLPGGGKCVIEVIASDGVLSTAARSANFSLANKAPEAWLFFENGGGKLSHTLTTAPVECGERLVLHARSSDLEDGNLPDASHSWNITGSINRTGAGRRFQPAGLIPGTYTVTLTAHDSSGATGTTTSTLIVRSAFVENASTNIDLDGLANDPGYAADRIAKEFRYSTNAGSAQVRLVHRNGQLFVGASGLMLGNHAQHRFAIAFDLNHSGGAPETNDLLVQIRDEGGVSVQRGNGLVWAEVTDPIGIEGNVSSDGIRWAAEFAISDTWLAGWNGRTVRCLIADLDRSAIGDNAVWPQDGNLYNLTTWANLVLGPDPEDPTDADRDGMADAWEIQRFGNTQGGANRDSDGDDQNDYEEFINGTNPRDAKSVLKVTITTDGPRRVLTWPSTPGRTYTVWRSEELLDFSPMATGIPASAGATTSWTDTTPLPGYDFYRIEVHPTR